MTPIVRERWGDFVLSPDASLEAHKTEFPAQRPGFSWLEGESPWTHRFAKQSTTAATAQADLRIPWPAYVPAGEDFLAASVLDDGSSAADGLVAFINSGNPDVSKYARRDGVRTGDDGTLKISWSRRFSRPAYMTAHVEPLPVNGTSLSDATVVEVDFRKVDINGSKGVLRVWEPRGAQSMYGSRLPTVLINWWDGPVYWSVQSTFLTAGEALRVAQSIRPTVTK